MQTALSTPPYRKQGNALSASNSSFSMTSQTLSSSRQHAKTHAHLRDVVASEISQLISKILSLFELVFCSISLGLAWSPTATCRLLNTATCLPHKDKRNPLNAFPKETTNALANISRNHSYAVVNKNTEISPK